MPRPKSPKLSPKPSQNVISTIFDLKKLPSTIAPEQLKSLQLLINEYHARLVIFTTPKYTMLQVPYYAPKVDAWSRTQVFDMLSNYSHFLIKGNVPAAEQKFEKKVIEKAKEVLLNPNADNMFKELAKFLEVIPRLKGSRFELGRLGDYPVWRPSVKYEECTDEDESNIDDAVPDHAN